MFMTLNMFRWLRFDNKGRGLGFEFIATRFDDGVKWHATFNGVEIGDTARLDWREGWSATYDSGDADTLRWYGGFRSRQEAAIFLLGAKAERDRRALSIVRGQSRPLEEVYTGQL